MNALVQKALGVFTGWTTDGPWRSKSVLAALAVTVLGLGIWFSDIKSHPVPAEAGGAVASAPGATPTGTVNPPASPRWNWSKPFPFYAPIGASYAAGFCIGWFFRRLIRMILIVTALVIALLALGKFAGCNVAPAQQRVKQTGDWAQHEATAGEDYLKHLLPSAGAGGAGTFLGFRRRSKMGPETQGRHE